MSEAKEAAITAKASPASKVGRPHWNGVGTFILQKQFKVVSFIIKLSNEFHTDIHKWILVKQNGNKSPGLKAMLNRSTYSIKTMNLWDKSNVLTDRRLQNLAKGINTRLTLIFK